MLGMIKVSRLIAETLQIVLLLYILHSAVNTPKIRGIGCVLGYCVM